MASRIKYLKKMPPGREIGNPAVWRIHGVKKADLSAGLRRLSNLIWRADALP